jgi:hypothetical protein
MGEYWSLESVHHLRELALEKTPVPVIAMTMRRGVGEVHAKLAELGLSAPMGVGGERDEAGADTRPDAPRAPAPGFGLMGDDADREARMAAPPQPEPGSASF